MPDDPPLNPGDEAAPDVPGAAEDLCRACGGSGVVDGLACVACGGSGKVVEAIGGG